MVSLTQPSQPGSGLRLDVLPCRSLEEFCKVRSEGTEQHLELREGRQSRDNQDLRKFVDSFDSHPPFADRPADELVSLSTGQFILPFYLTSVSSSFINASCSPLFGVVANSSVNCDIAFEVGLHYLKPVNGNAGLKMKRSDRVKRTLV